MVHEIKLTDFREYDANSCYNVQAFGLNKNGTPKHPLYLSYETELLNYPLVLVMIGLMKTKTCLLKKFQ